MMYMNIALCAARSLKYKGIHAFTMVLRTALVDRRFAHELSGIRLSHSLSCAIKHTRVAFFIVCTTHLYHLSRIF